MILSIKKWREGPQQTARLVQDGSPQLMVEHLGKWREGPQQTARLIQDGSPQLRNTKITRSNQRLVEYVRTVYSSGPRY